MSKPEWKVGDVYSKAIAEASIQERKDTLESLAYRFEKGPYVKPLNKKELSVKREELAELAITIARLEDKKKELVAELKEEMKQPKTLFDEAREAIKYKKENRSGTLYMIDDQDNELMFIFDESATCVDMRALRKEEKQRVLKMSANTGTDGE